MSVAHNADPCVSPSVAVVIPCLDEEAAVADVVRDFASALPGASIYVFDNASTDGTAGAARTAGARVRSEPRRGKGNALRRAFADVEADVYVVVDGDGTYPARAAPAMVAALVEGALDMVVGARVAATEGAFPPGHRLGNAMISRAVAWLFGPGFGDALSGYRVLSRRFVKSFPAAAPAFAVETEMAVHALTMRLPCAEHEVAYAERTPGSRSKLRTFRDGLAIAGTLLVLLKDERPLAFFAGVFALLLATALVAWPALAGGTAAAGAQPVGAVVVCAGLAAAGIGALGCGVVLDSAARARREARRLRYLALRPPPPGARGETVD